jgi:hypothetical protein
MLQPKHFDTSGGLRTFAAVGTEVCYAAEMDAKLGERLARAEPTTASRTVSIAPECPERTHVGALGQSNYADRPVVQVVSFVVSRCNILVDQQFTFVLLQATSGSLAVAVRVCPQAWEECK